MGTDAELRQDLRAARDREPDSGPDSDRDPDRDPDRAPERDSHRGDAGAASLFALGTGALLACLLALAGTSGAIAPPGEVAAWVADRDAGRVFGLDRDLLIARRIPVDWPLDVEPAPDGGLWVLRSAAGTARSTHRLDRFGPAGGLITELWIERGLDLDVLAAGEQALVVEEREAAPTRVIRVREEGSLFPVFERDGIACVVGERSSAVIGTRDGHVLRVDVATQAVIAGASVGGEIVDLARGPEAGSLWALDAAGSGRVLLLARDLPVRWIAALPRRAAHLAPEPGQERVWLAGVHEPCVVRLGPGGALELDRCGLPLPGLDRALAWPPGGALLATPGAVLRLDPSGTLLPGQGGFEFLVDVAPADR